MQSFQTRFLRRRGLLGMGYLDKRMGSFRAETDRKLLHEIWKRESNRKGSRYKRGLILIQKCLKNKSEEKIAHGHQNGMHLRFGKLHSLPKSRTNWF